FTKFAKYFQKFSLCTWFFVLKTGNFSAFISLLLCLSNYEFSRQSGKNGEWRIRYNEEINQIIKGRDIVKFIKSLRLQWLGHLHKAKIYSVRRKGRPRTRWMDDVMEDIRIMKIRGWREKIKDRGGWSRIVKEAKAHIRLYRRIVSKTIREISCFRQLLYFHVMHVACIQAIP
ncbi:hypothetical protein C0J52_14696, partial [Blattella germanica]